MEMLKREERGLTFCNERGFFFLRKKIAYSGMIEGCDRESLCRLPPSGIRPGAQGVHSNASKRQDMYVYMC